MRVRRVAILIDGAFLLKRLPYVSDKPSHETPEAVAETVRLMCRRHIQRLAHLEPPARTWIDHVYRIFYYDAEPFAGMAENPVSKRQIKYGLSDEAIFRRDLFDQFRKSRKFALRLGRLRHGDWRIDPKLTKRFIRAARAVNNVKPILDAVGDAGVTLNAEQVDALRQAADLFGELTDASVEFPLRQKGVDMRIGVDIVSLTLKRQVDTIILVTGDSDFVPAAKVARREGVEFILDPLRQSVEDELFEHIDGLISVLRKGRPPTPEDSEDDD